MKRKKIMSITEFLKDYFKKLDANVKVAFMTAMASTFLCHIVYFINRWANEDDFHEIMGQLNMIGSGRWMPGTILSSNFLAPIVLLVIAMVFLSLISVMIVDLFKVKKKTYVAFIALILTSFPVLALGFGYGFMVERYVLGMFFAVLAVYSCSKYKFGIIPGSLALAITMGYYQSYIAISISLIILHVIVRMLEKFDNKDNIKLVLKYLIMGACGIILYMLTVRLVCHFTGVPLLDYKGINNMGSLPPLDQFVPLLKRTYEDFFNFYLGRKFLRPLIYGRISQILLFLVNIFLIIYIAYKQKVYKRPLNMALLFVFLIFLPLGFNIVDFIAYESETSSLNIYQFVFVFIYPFILLGLLEDGFFKKTKQNEVLNITSWIVIICGIAILWSNFVLTNIYYLKVNDFYTTTVQLTNRVFDRIEQMPNYEGSVPVMVGNKNGIYMDQRVYKDYYKVLTYDQGLWDQFIGYAPRPTGTDFKFHYLVENIIGVHLPSVTPEKFEEIYESEEYEEMEAWPHKDSLKYIDDVLVVKIS